MKIYAPKPTEVKVDQITKTGEKIGTITINGNPVDLYAPEQTPSGDTVEVSADLTKGAKVATITINGIATNIYAPELPVVTAPPFGGKSPNYERYTYTDGLKSGDTVTFTSSNRGVLVVSISDRSVCYVIQTVNDILTVSGRIKLSGDYSDIDGISISIDENGIILTLSKDYSYFYACLYYPTNVISQAESYTTTSTTSYKPSDTQITGKNTIGLSIVGATLWAIFVSGKIVASNQGNNPTYVEDSNGIIFRVTGSNVGKQDIKTYIVGTVDTGTN